MPFHVSRSDNVNIQGQNIVEISLRYFSYPVKLDDGKQKTSIVFFGVYEGKLIYYHDPLDAFIIISFSRYYNIADIL